MKAEGRSSIGGGDELVDVALWLPFGRDPRTRRDQHQSTLFRFRRFPTRTTLHGEIVVGELIRISSRQILHVSYRIAHVSIGTTPHSSRRGCTHICMSSQPKDQGNTHSPVEHSTSTEGLTPGRVGEPPALIAYVIYLPYSV